MIFNASRSAFAFALLGLCLCLTPAHASLETAERHVSNPEIVGKGRMKVMFWNVFDATLYAEGGHYDADKPFALSLSYLRKLKGRKIVDKTISEIRRQGTSNATSQVQWTKALLNIISDVDASTTITGIRDAEGHTLFYRNGSPIGRIDDPAFTKAFFDIWLGDSSNQPELTRQLIGQPDS